MNHSVLTNLSSAEARGKRLRFIREHLLSLTREEFCCNANITAPSLKGWELAWGGGLSQQGAEKVVLRAKELHVYCTEFWLMHGIGRAATYMTAEFALEEGDHAHIAKELLLFREQLNAVDTVIKDDCMSPIFAPGDYVGGIIVKNIQTAIDKECIVMTDKDELLVRCLKNGDQLGLFHLSCINQQTKLVKKEIKNISIKFAAPIIWIRKIFHE